MTDTQAANTHAEQSAQAAQQAAERETQRVIAKAHDYTRGEQLVTVEIVEGKHWIPALWLFYTGGKHVLCSGSADNFYCGAIDTVKPESKYGEPYRAGTAEQARDWLAAKGYRVEIIAALICPR